MDSGGGKEEGGEEGRAHAAKVPDAAAAYQGRWVNVMAAPTNVFAAAI
jgi:hypothetical protein